MTFHVISSEVAVTAIGLSMAFVGVMLSMAILGIILFAYGLKKKDVHYLIRMGGLIVGWAIFMFLNLKSSSDPGHQPLFLAYSWFHIFSLIISTIVFSSFLLMLPKLWKKFDHELLVTAGFFAVVSILMRAVFPFFQNVYLSMLQRFVIIIPPLLGFFMIIKLLVGGRNEK